MNGNIDDELKVVKRSNWPIKIYAMGLFTIIPIAIYHAYTSSTIHVEFHGVNSFYGCSEEKPFEVTMQNRSHQEITGFYVEAYVIPIENAKSISGDTIIYKNIKIKPDSYYKNCFAANLSVDAATLSNFQNIEVITKNSSITYSN